MRHPAVWGFAGVHHGLVDTRSGMKHVGSLRAALMAQCLIQKLPWHVGGRLVLPALRGLARRLPLPALRRLVE